MRNAATGRGTGVAALAETAIAEGWRIDESATGEPDVRRIEPAGNGQIAITMRARTATLALRDVRWTTTAMWWDASTGPGGGRVSISVEHLRHAARILGMREGAARRRGVGRLGLGVGGVLVDAALARSRISNAPRSIRTKTAECLRRARGRDPGDAVHPATGGLTLLTLDDPGSEHHGMPVATPNPVTIATSRHADEAAVDRLRMTHDGGTLVLDLFGVEPPATVLAGAPGRRLGDVVDLSDALWDDVARRDLEDRTILSMEHRASMDPTGPIIPGATVLLPARLVALDETDPPRGLARLVRRLMRGDGAPTNEHEGTTQ